MKINPRGVVVRQWDITQSMTYDYWMDLYVGGVLKTERAKAMEYTKYSMSMTAAIALYILGWPHKVDVQVRRDDETTQPGPSALASDSPE